MEGFLVDFLVYSNINNYVKQANDDQCDFTGGNSLVIVKCGRK